MKPKTMILLGLAITCGLGASYMTSRLLAERQVSEEPEKVEILVARKNLSVHTRITSPEDLFEKKTVSKENGPTDAIGDFDQLKGKSLKMGRMKGESVSAAHLYDKGQLEIPEGHQAVGVRVNIETALSGLASLPGSRVDLHLILTGQDPRATKGIVLLENVLVLNADIRVNAEGEIAAPAQVVGFALKQEDSLLVNTAKRMGEISLVLRNKDEHATATVREKTGAQILDRTKKDEPPVVAKVADPTPPPVVPKEVVPPPVEDKRPKVTKHRYPIVNGTEQGQRSVEWVEYYKHEDGRILPPDHPEVQEAIRPFEDNGPAPKKKGGGPIDL